MLSLFWHNVLAVLFWLALIVLVLVLALRPNTWFLGLVGAIIVIVGCRLAISFYVRSRELRRGVKEILERRKK